MKNKRCCVIIPIYKEHLENFEVLSLHRVYLVLGETYDIKFLTYYELNTQEYADIAYKYGFPFIERIHFKKKYFINNCGTLGYNLLMTNYRLYEQLLDYEYILVYHLDCYIFKNDLDYWMDKGDDHIECIIDNEQHKGDGVIGFWYNGEGLRKVKTFYEFTKNNIEQIRKLHLVCLYDYLFTWDDTEADWFGLKYEGFLAEDAFFSSLIHKEGYWMWRNFGWSNMYKEKFEEFGQLPTMLHWFQKYEWSKEYIGDWDNDLDNCINNPKFIEMKLL